MKFDIKSSLLWVLVAFFLGHSQNALSNESETIDISKITPNLEKPMKVRRNVNYFIGDLIPDKVDLNEKKFASRSFAIHLPYIDTRNFVVYAKAKSGNVLVLVDFLNEPFQRKYEDDGMYEWVADCISTDSTRSHPKNACHVQRWAKEHDNSTNEDDKNDRVSYGGWYIKLVAYEPIKDLELFIENKTAFDNVDTNFTINGKPYQKDEFQLEPKKPAKLKFSYKYAGEDDNLAMTMYHGKMMHMILFKPDLSHLIHIHPKFNMMKKEFEISLNTAPKKGEDNQGLKTAIPDAGTYYMLTETRPVIKGEQLQPWYSRYKLNAYGDNVPESEPLELEYDDEEGHALKYFTEDGSQGKKGDFYEVKIIRNYNPVCFKWVLSFEVFIRIWDGRKYVPLAKHDFNRWLMMPGHAIYIKEQLGKNNDLMDRPFYHAHSMGFSEDGSGLLSYPAHSHGLGIPEGRFKVWVQTKLRKTVLSFPFVFDVKLPAFGLSENLYGEQLVNANKQSTCAKL